MAECFEEEGIVKDVVNGLLQISIAANNRCRSCSICSIGPEKEMRLTVASSGNFSVGERVKLKIEGRNILLASFIVYIVPLIDMFIGYALGYFLTYKLGTPAKAPLVGILTAGVFFAASFFFSRLLNNRLERQANYLIKVEKYE